MTYLSIQSQVPERYQPYVVQRQRQKADVRSRLYRRYETGIHTAQKFAHILKTEYGVTRVVLFGSMRSPSSVNLRSDIDLAVWGLTCKSYISALSRLCAEADTFDIDLVRIEEAPASLKSCILAEGLVLEGETCSGFHSSETLPERFALSMSYGPLIGKIRRLLRDLSNQYDYTQQQAKVAKETNQSAYWNDVAYSLQGFYTGLEKIFEMVARQVDGGLDRQDSRWHKALLEQMVVENAGVRPAVIDEETYRYLNGYLKFRHVVRSHYTYRLDPELIAERLEVFPDCYSRVCRQIEEFCDFLAAMG